MHAARLFEEKGLHRTSVADIAEAVGIQKPTLYHYFRSKQEIVASIHVEYASEMLRRLYARSSLTMKPSLQLLEVMVDLLEVVASHRGHVLSYWENRRELGPKEQEIVRAQRAEYQERVQEIIQAGIDNGEFRNLDPHLATFAVFGMVSWAMHWYRPEGDLRPRDVAYTFWEFLVNGFTAG